MDDAALDILLIEDNPPDARLIEEMLRDSTSLVRMVQQDDTSSEAIIHVESRLADGLEFLDKNSVDVVLLDLDLPDSRGLETVVTVLEATTFVPVVVLTRMDDEGIGLESIHHGAQEYLVKGEVTSELLVRSIYHAIERNRQEHERAQYLRQLETLNRLNRISQDISHTVITSPTVEELEQAVCDRLVASDAYHSAWIGTVNRGAGTVSPKIFAGLDEVHLEGNEFDLDGDDPTVEALREREVRIDRTNGQSSAGQSLQAAPDQAIQSLIAIPLAHEGFLFGVLTVYSTDSLAFSDREAVIFSRLGDVIGHALAAIERREALVNETVLELEFLVDDLFADIVGATEDGGSIRSKTIARGEKTLVVYAEVEGITQEVIASIREESDEIADIRVLTDRNGVFDAEFIVEEGWELANQLAEIGGSLEETIISNGEFRLVLGFPPGIDKHQLVDVVEQHCPSASLFSQRTVERNEMKVDTAHSVFEDQLREKQRTALETAYHAGFFEWPRESSGEEVAARLGVSSATFSQHLRRAEREIFSVFFEQIEE